MKIALYSHDTMGLGHIRRNMLIARALVDSDLEADVLLIAGIREAGAFRIPDHVDCLILPAYRKDINGQYAPRNLSIQTETLVALRSEVIAAALANFEPDLFIVDNVPRGALEELTPVLDGLKKAGTTRCVLGLRDILDDPDKIRRQWESRDNATALREYYDAVWIYGDRQVYDLGRQYAFSPDIQRKITYTGYLDPGLRLVGIEPESGDVDASVFLCEYPEARFTLCSMGGGQDGFAVATAFARAVLPPGEFGVIVTGPFLPPAHREYLEQLVAANPRMRMMKFLAEPMLLMRRAARIISMGGYNTVTEILSLGKRALIVPRSQPRLEQTIRARRLCEYGLVDCVDFDSLTPGCLTRWMAADAQPAPAREVIDFQGLEHIPQLVADMVCA